MGKSVDANTIFWFFLNKNTLAYFFGIFDDAEKSFQKYGLGLNCLFKKMDVLDTLTLDFSWKNIHFSDESALAYWRLALVYTNSGCSYTGFQCWCWCCLSFRLFVNSFICPSIRLPVYLFVCLFVCLSICSSVYPSICLPICLSVHL